MTYTSIISMTFTNNMTDTIRTYLCDMNINYEFKANEIIIELIILN